MKKIHLLRNIKSSPEVIKAISYAIAFYFAANSFNFYPTSIVIYLSIAILFFAIAMPDFAIWLFLVALTFPIYALRIELLLLYAVPAIVLGRFFNEKRGLFFVLMMISIIGSFSMLELAPLLLGVYFLGLGSAFLAGVSALSIQTIGVLLGKPIQGIFISAGSELMIPEKFGVPFNKLTDLSLNWSHIQNFDFNFYAKLIQKFVDNPALFIQPLIWIGVAVIGAKLIERSRNGVAATYIGITAATLIAHVVLNSAFGGGLVLSKVALTGAFSFLFSMFLTYPTLQYGAGIFGNRAVEAVLVIDIVGSTRLAEKYGDELSMKVKNRLDIIVKNVISKYNYRFIKGTGDGYFVTFPDSDRAASAALEIIRTNDEQKAKLKGEEKIDLKMGLASGEIIATKDDRHGSIVNIAFRVQAVDVLSMVDTESAEEDFPVANCLLSSESAVEGLSGENFDIKFLGFFEAKGLYGRHRLYDIKEKVAVDEKPHFKVIKEVVNDDKKKQATKENKDDPPVKV